MNRVFAPDGALPAQHRVDLRQTETGVRPVRQKSDVHEGPAPGRLVGQRQAIDDLFSLARMVRGKILEITETGEGQHQKKERKKREDKVEKKDIKEHAGHGESRQVDDHQAEQPDADGATPDAQTRHRSRPVGVFTWEMISLTTWAAVTFSSRASALR